MPFQCRLNLEDYSAYTTSLTTVWTMRVRKRTLLNQTPMGRLLNISEQLMSLQWLKSLQIELLFVDEGTGWTQRPTSAMTLSRVMAARQSPSPAPLSTHTVTLDKSLGTWGLHLLICSRGPLGSRICIIPSCSKTLHSKAIIAEPGQN